MIFVRSYQGHIQEFAVFGQNERRGGDSLFVDTLYHNTSFSIRCVSFEKLPRMYGASFSQVEIAGHKLVGYCDAPPNAISPEYATVAGVSLIDLITFYQNYTASNPQFQMHADPNSNNFEQWLRANPMLNRRARGGQRVLPGLVRTYEGEWLLMYYQDNRVVAEVIAETCFIRNCVITPLPAVLDTAIEYKRNELEELQRRLEPLRSNPWDIVDKLARSNYGLLPCIADRPKS